MFSYTYPFVIFTASDWWIGVKPAVIFYFLYFALSGAYKCWLWHTHCKKTTGHSQSAKNPTNSTDCGNAASRKKASYMLTYLSLLLLYLVLPSVGKTEEPLFIFSIADTYLRYETLLSAIIFLALLIAIARGSTWQYIRIIDRILIYIILGTVFCTILARQVDSFWSANFACFSLLGLTCWQLWFWWEKFNPITNSAKMEIGFQPVQNYEQLFPQQKQLADDLVSIIQNSTVPMSICIAGKWGSGKTSIVNAAVDRLKHTPAPSQYDCIYINAMELDTQSSLFTYIFNRIRNILKKHGAYVGIGSEYRQFLASAVGKITDISLATLLEKKLFPTIDDYRLQLKELDECISTGLKQDKILIIVDDVERCDTTKAQQFIFFIKEIATLSNCVTLFLTDFDYLSRRQLSNETENSDIQENIDYRFYEKFFNYRIDVPPLIISETLDWIDQGLQEETNKLEFRPLSKLINLFKEKLKTKAEEYSDAAKKIKDEASKNSKLARADEMNRLYELFCSKLSLPRTLVRFVYTAKEEYSKLINQYTENGILKDEAFRFFQWSRFDEILFLLCYMRVCAPYEFYCLNSQGLDYLQYPEETSSDTRRLIKEMGTDLLYINDTKYFASEDDSFRYSETSRFTEAYLSGKLLESVTKFSNRDEQWLYAIQTNDRELIDPNWPEMVNMVARNYSWQNSEKGKECLNLLFDYARENFLSSLNGMERVFAIFEHKSRNEDTFSAHIPVIKLFFQKFKDDLVSCSPKCLEVLNEFSVGYFWKRTSPICSAALYMAPPKYSKDREFQNRISDVNETMLSSENPVENLNKLLNRISEEVPSIVIPPDGNVFHRLSILADEEERSLERQNLLRFKGIKERVQLLRTAVEDMECFVLLIQAVKEHTISAGITVTPDSLLDLDKTIYQLKAALSTPSANKSPSLHMDIQEFIELIRYSDVILSEWHYEELQDIVTESEELYGTANYFRKILADHRKCE